MRLITTLKSRFRAFLLHKLNIHVKRIPKKGSEIFPNTVHTEFVKSYRKYYELTMVPWRPLYWSWLSARYIDEHQVPGDVVECGVFKGGCSLIMAEAHDRTVWMYDTFTGMSEPTEHDYKGTYKGERFDPVKRHRSAIRDGFVDWVYGCIDGVKDAIDRSGLATSRFRLVQGKVEDTIPETIPEKIALLRLDTDFYESTKHELEHLYPLLSDGGILIVDDYGSWAGSRKAVDEYFEKVTPRPLMVPEGSSGNIMVIKS
jgi:O-methyltransferase